MQRLYNENISNKNTQDIFIRNATISLLDLLNREVVITLKREERLEEFEIPFFYNFGTDEGFMKDFFMELPTDCKYPNHAEGNYEKLPRGIVTFSSFSIKSQDITNKFVRGSYLQESRDENDQKQLKAFSSRLFTLPMNLTYSIAIESNSLNIMFKIIEKIFDFYYKNQVRYFQYRGIRVPAQVIFPETADMQKPYSFTYADNNIIKNSFQVTVETYFPSFNDYSTFYKGNKIDQININQKLKDSNITLDSSFIDSDFPPSE